jgi:uncharacterized protein
MNATQSSSVPLAVSNFSQTKRTVWIDLDNSPHVPFFAPIIEELEALGHSVLVTARDFAQVCQLADLMHLKYTKVGRHYGKNTLVKLAALSTRALQLLPLVARARPDLALSHGSRSQLLLAAVLRIPALTIGDYEHARVFAGVKPRWVIVPQVFPKDAWHMSPEHILRYPGIKEDVYVPRFKPDPEVLTLLGLDASNILVTVRPPATHAHYHNPESDTIFEAVMQRLIAAEQVQVILLPRTPEQDAGIRRVWREHFESGKLLIPAHVVDGLNLIWFSDFVISGGGTMNREAAALGVPVYSTFRGKIGAVDKYLVQEGRLILVESVQDVQQKLFIRHRQKRATPAVTGDTLNVIVSHIQHVIEAECRRA